MKFYYCDTGCEEGRLYCDDNLEMKADTKEEKSDVEN